MRATILTHSGSTIDIVDDVEEVVSSYYILRKDVDSLCDRSTELGGPPVTNSIAKVLIREGFLHKNEKVHASSRS